MKAATENSPKRRAIVSKSVVASLTAFWKKRRKWSWSRNWRCYKATARSAWILRCGRYRARLSLEAAARSAKIDQGLLRKYELGMRSPPLSTLASLLRIYEAPADTTFYFCTIKIHAGGPQKNNGRAPLRAPATSSAESS